MKARKILFTVNAVRWFDRVNGNTYHSVRITRIRDNKTIVQGMTYGYGDQYRYTALEAMSMAKWLPVKYRGTYSTGSPMSVMYERENNYPIIWNVQDGLKRDMIRNGNA